MNRKERNSLEYTKAQLEEFSDNTILEVLPQKTDEGSSSKCVLIKHDYYSSDSEHGRNLLASFLASITDSSYHSVIVYLVDKGVLLLDRSNALYEQMQLLIKKAEMVIVDEDSAFIYNVNDYTNTQISVQSFKSISEDILYSSDLLILE